MEPANNPAHLNNTGDLALKHAQIAVISSPIVTPARTHLLILLSVQDALMDIHFQIINVLLAHMAAMYVLQLQTALNALKDLHSQSSPQILLSAPSKAVLMATTGDIQHKNVLIVAMVLKNVLILFKINHKLLLVKMVTVSSMVHASNVQVAAVHA